MEDEADEKVGLELMKKKNIPFIINLSTVMELGHLESETVDYKMFYETY